MPFCTAAKKMLAGLAAFCVILFGSADFSHCIVDDKLSSAVFSNSDAAVHYQIPSKRFSDLPSDRDLMVFAQLTGVLLLIVLLVFIWNRKLSKLNSSLNLEVSRRRRMEKVHGVMNRIALAVTGVSGIDEFYSFIHSQINSLVYARNFFIASYDSDTGTISYPYFSDENKSYLEPRKISYGLTDYVIRSGTPLYVDKKIRKKMAEKGNYELVGHEAAIWIGAPLKLEGRTVGVIAVQSYDKKSRLSKDDLDVLVFISSYIGLALERVQLLEQGRIQTRALMDSEERFRSLFEDSADATVLLEDLKVTECNTAAYNLLGMSSKEEMLGLSPNDFSPEFQPDGSSSSLEIPLIAQMVRDSGGARFEWIIRRKDNSTFPVEVLITPISYSDREIFHVVLRDITERKAREAALIEREVKYRALFDFASDAVILMDLNKNIVSANPEAVAMFRCSSEEELLSYSLVSLMPPVQPDGKQSMALMESRHNYILKSGGLDFEVVCRRLDGDDFLARVRVRKLEVSGEVFLQGTVSDITEQSKVQEEIERTVSLLTATIESSADGILAVDGYGRVVAWNSRLASMWKLSEFDLKSGIVSDVFGFIADQVDSRESSMKSLWDYSLESDTGQVDELVLKDGRIIERYSNPQRIGRDIVGRVWSFRDVTDRRLGERELRASYHRLNDIIEFLPDPTMVIDSDGIVVAWNKAIEEISGVSKEEMIGRGDYAYALPFYNERRPILIDSALCDGCELPAGRYESVEVKGNVLYGEVYTPQSFDGKGAYLWGVAGPLKDDTGKIVGAIECMRDVTERRRVEQELQRARIAAEAATRVKSEFLANMSHEIRTPMNSIVGFGSLLEGSDLDSSQQEYLDKMLSSADSLLSIIDDILDFSKIEAGKFVLEDVEFDIDEVLSKICNMVAVKAEKKGIDFILSVAKDVPHKIYGDPLRLEQVLTNLVNNAVKFTGEGEVSLVVSCCGECADRADIEFVVQDSGIGLNADELNSLFSSFTQADASTTRKYGGTGLGLAITNSLVTQMGGAISVESEPGVGSRFSFTISFDVIESGVDFVVPDFMHAMKVLVVDDSPLTQGFIGTTLENLSFNVIQKSSAVSAIDALKESQESGNGFDLVYMDWKMSGLGGLEAVSIIRDIQILQDIPVILMVPVDADENFRKRAALNGVDGFISKPVTRLSLYESLRNEFEMGKEPVAETVRDNAPEAVLSTKSARVLLVEDNELNQQVAKRLLEGFGVEVDVAENGRKALEALWQTTYDLVFMDIQMPEMDGLTATRLIRSDERYKKLPIVAMTAHAMRGDREKSLEAGMNEHLTKPIDPQKLHEALNRFLTTAEVPYVPLAELDHVREGFLPEVAGVDCEQGLKNIGGNLKGYLRVLQGFRKDYAGFNKMIRELAEQENYSAVAVKLHSLKGVAGNIGAFGLYELCRIMDGDLRERDYDTFRSDLELFSSELELIIEGLGCVGQSLTSQVHENVFDQEKSYNLIDKLYKMLREGDAESFYLLEKLRVYFNPEGFEELLDELTEDIENYDFDEGCVILERIAEKIGMNLTDG